MGEETRNQILEEGKIDFGAELFDEGLDLISGERLPIGDKIEEGVSDTPVPPKQESKEETEESGKEVKPEPEVDAEKSEVKLKIKGNPLTIFAKKWVEDGILPEDFEVTDDLTDDQLNSALFSHKEKQEYESLKVQAKRNFFEEEGVTADAWERAKKISAGISEREIQTEELYNYLATVQVDEGQEGYEEFVKNVAVNFYHDQGFSEAKIKRYVERDLEALEDGEDILKEYQDHFKNRVVQIKAEHQSKLEQKETDRLKSLRKKQNRLNKFYENGELDGVTYTPEQREFARKAITEKNQVYVDPNTGDRYRVTLEKKKILEARNNFEKSLKARIDYILGYDAQKIKERSKTEAKSDILKELNKMVVVDRIVQKDSEGNPISESSRIEDGELLF